MNKCEECGREIQKGKEVWIPLQYVDFDECEPHCKNCAEMVVYE